MYTETTSQPGDASVSFEHADTHISQNEHGLLSNDLMQGINAALGARSTLEENLRDWRAMYEMETPKLVNPPWPGSSNITLPIIPTQVDSMLAYIIAKVLVPRFFIVTGNTPPAQTTAAQVERYYTVELVKQRGRTTWYEELAHWMHLGILDGTGYMECMWHRSVTYRKLRKMKPVLVDGVPVIDADTGKPREEPEVVEVKIINYDDVRWVRRQLKDVILMPATAPSPQEAAGVAIVEWLYESDLNALMRDATERGVGKWWPEEVERALSYVQDGTSDDIASDRQGDYDKTEGGQVNPGDAQGSHTSPFFKQRGPIKVFRIHSDQYDMDRDGEVEECIFYYHDRTQMCLGWMPYEYLIGERPIFDFSPAPRPTEAIGFSIIQRLGSLSAEISRMYNDRNNAVDLALHPPRVTSAGAKLITGDNQWGPGVGWEGEPGSVEYIRVPDVPLASFQQESETKQYVSELTGQNMPAVGAQSSGRRTATENRIQSAGANVRLDLVAMRFRVACRALINFTHRLKLQYLPHTDEQGQPAVMSGSDNSGPFTLPFQVLAQDYRIDISGASDPLDAATRLSQDVGIYEQLSQNPLVASNVMHLYYLTRQLLEAAGTQNIDQIIGTAEEAQAMMQRQKEAAQKQAAMGGAPQGQPHGAQSNGKAGAAK